VPDHATSDRAVKRFHFWFGRMQICDHLQLRIGRLGFDVYWWKRGWEDEADG